jgi:hypothetical protein
MSYYQKVEWTITPKSAPKVFRNCPKCGEKTHYVNSTKFRVNANGKNLDIWLIYNCSKCKSKWNMPIHERINPKDIDPERFDCYIKNDKDLANHIGTDPVIHKRNNSELVYDSMEFNVMVSKLQDKDYAEQSQEITIRCPLSLNLRLDKLLADHIGISRSKISKTLSEHLPLKNKIKDGMTFILPGDY